MVLLAHGNNYFLFYNAEEQFFIAGEGLETVAFSLTHPTHVKV